MAIRELEQDVSNSTVAEGILYKQYLLERKYSINNLFFEFNSKVFYVMNNQYYSDIFQEYSINGRIRTYSFLSPKLIILYYTIIKYLDIVIKDSLESYSSCSESNGFYSIKKKQDRGDFEKIIESEYKKNNAEYSLKMDIKDFFANIDHEILLMTVDKYSYKKNSIKLNEYGVRTEIVDILNFIKNGQKKGIPLFRFNSYPSLIIPNLYLIGFSEKIFDYYDRAMEIKTEKIFRVCDDVEILYKTNIDYKRFIYETNIFTSRIQIEYLSTLGLELNDKKTKVTFKPKIKDSSIFHNWSHYTCDENGEETEFEIDNTEEDLKYLEEKYKEFEDNGKIDKMKSFIDKKSIAIFVNKNISIFNLANIEFFLYFISYVNSSVINSVAIPILKTKPIIISEIYKYFIKRNGESRIWLKLLIDVANKDQEMAKKLKLYFEKKNGIYEKLIYFQLTGDSSHIDINRINILNNINSFNIRLNNRNIQLHMKMLSQSIKSLDWTLASNHLLNFIQAYVLNFSNAKGFDSEKLTDNSKIIKFLMDHKILSGMEKIKLEDLGSIRNKNIRSHPNIKSHEEMLFVSKITFEEFLIIVDQVIFKINKIVERS